MREERALHVAVIGASLAGLFTAAAASSAGHRVTLIERDPLPTSAQPRPGVPQSEQGHLLLHRGLLAAEDLLPGLRQQLLDHGAARFRTGRLPWLGAEGWSPLGDYGYEVVCLSRPLLEHLVRQRVLALPGVQVRTGMRARGLHRLDEGRWRIELTEASPRPAPPASAGGSSASAAHLAQGAAPEPAVEGTVSPVETDVVIDASGRSSRLPHWLRALGLTEAAVTQVDAHMGYATRRYTSSRPPGPGVVIATTPQRRRGCVIGPIEDGQWLVSAVGVGEQRPGREEEAFTAHLHQLPDPAAADLVAQMSPLGGVAVHRQTGNVRHHYEHVPDWPAGLLAVGDSLCAVNPVYGQGMTVAALQALTLRRHLDTATPRAFTRPAGTRKLQRKLARTADTPWMMATSQDRQFLPEPGRQKLHEALLERWIGEVNRLAMSGDVRASATLQRVGHLMAPPAAVLNPALLLAAARARLRTSAA